jgi:cytochrome c oxidase assembly protein subunit 15
VGGIYLEHSHRLFGALVGLTTLALFGRLLAAEPRGWVRAAGGAALLLVVAQGVLGGLRVTGHLTLSTSPEVTRPSLALAMVHGITGQIFFAWMVCLAAFTSPTWKQRIGAAATAVPGTERAVAWMVVGALLLQLLLGVRARHTGQGTMLHMTFAVVVLVLCMTLAVRILGGLGHVRALRKAAGALLGHVGTQVVLGLLAFVLMSRRAGEDVPATPEVLVTTLHQTVGALLLANAALLVVWTGRLLHEERA